MCYIPTLYLCCSIPLLERCDLRGRFIAKKFWACGREWMLFAVCGQIHPALRFVCPVLSHFYLPTMFFFFEKHVASFVIYCSVKELCVYFFNKIVYNSNVTRL